MNDNTPKLSRVMRLDALPFRQTFYTEEGYLRDKPILTRVGIFEYTNPDGSIRRELRLPDEVFSKESLESYRGKPIIISHDAGLIDKNNVADESIGTILSEGYRSGDNVRAEIVIHDTDAMRKSGMKELSLGYSLDLDETPGTWNGQHYDAVQRNILVNHLALVREARAGDKARLNIDSRETNSSKGGAEMTHTKRADGILSAEELEEAIAQYKANRASEEENPVKEEAEAVEFKTDEPQEEAPVVLAKESEEDVVEDEDIPVEEKIEKIKSNNPEATGDMKALFDIIDSLLAEREFKDAKAPTEEPQMDGDDEEVFEETKDEEIPEDDEMVEEEEEKVEEENADGCEDEDEPRKDCNPSKKTMNADAIDRAVRARVQVCMMGKSLNLDGLETMSLRKAKKAVIKAVRPTMNLDGKSDSFVNAAYEMACDEVKSRSKKDTKYQKRQMFSNKVREDSNEDSSTNARERMISRQLNKKIKEDK